MRSFPISYTSTAALLLSILLNGCGNVVLDDASGKGGGQGGESGSSTTDTKADCANGDPNLTCVDCGPLGTTIMTAVPAHGLALCYYLDAALHEAGQTIGIGGNITKDAG